MVTGDRQRGFREGWAVKSGPDGTGGHAHYFRRRGVGLCISACESEEAAAGWLFAPGNFTKCGKCLSVVEEDAGKSPRIAQDARGGVPMARRGEDCSR